MNTSDNQLRCLVKKILINIAFGNIKKNHKISMGQVRHMPGAGSPVANLPHTIHGEPAPNNLFVILADL